MLQFGIVELRFLGEQGRHIVQTENDTVYLVEMNEFNKNTCSVLVQMEGGGLGCRFLLYVYVFSSLLNLFF